MLLARFLLISVSVGCEPTNRLWYVDLDTLPRSNDALDFAPYDLQKGDAAKPLPLVKLIDDFEASWDVIANSGTAFTLQTNLQAPRYRFAPAPCTVPLSSQARALPAGDCTSCQGNIILIGMLLASIDMTSMA